MTSSFAQDASAAVPAAAAVSESIPLLDLLQGVQDPSARIMCENMLKQLEANEGYCFEMLKIASQENLLASRQLAAIQLKNIVKRRWNPSAAALKKGIQPIPGLDKKEIMANLHECVVRSPREVQAQLLEVVREVASHDYPNSWSNILPECLASLAGSDPSRVYGSLLVLRKVASAIEFASHHGTSLQEFSNAALPTLSQVMLKLLAEPPSENLAVLQRVAVKILWSCLYLSIPDCLTKNPDLARHWLQVILKMMQQPLPEAATDIRASSTEQLERSPWWLLRKWLMRLAFRLEDRYGDPKIIKVETAQPFASLFLAEFSSDYLQCVLQYAKSIGEGQWASRQSISYTCRYLQTAVKQDAGREYLKPFLFEMLVHVALPLTFFNQELHTEWTEDPMEVIRRNSAALITVTTDDMYDRRDASVNLIRDIMKTKTLSAALLDPFMKVLMDIIVEFKQCDPTVDQARHTELAYKTDGVLLVLGTLLDPILVRHKVYKDGLQTIAQDHILPLFASQYEFLRAKAAWLAGVFVSELAFTTSDGSRKKGHGELFDQLFDCTLRCMKDPDLPVQVEGVNAFRDFVEQLGEAGRLVDKLQPILQDLLRHLFQMTALVEAMDVIMAVDTIIERVGDAIQPYAVQCARELIGVYARVVNEADGDLDSEKLFDQGYHILAPIIKLLEACSNIPTILDSFEELLEPLLKDLCTRDTEPLFEQVCEILGYFTYFSNPLSQRLWAFWPVLESSLCTTAWGIEYTENIIVPLDNFICRGTEVFCTSTAPNYRESVFRMVKHCFDLSNVEFCDNERELKPITKLLDIVLLNCGGRMDEWVWPYIEVCMNRITAAKDHGFGTLLMNVVAAALVYNAELTLKALEANGRTMQVFDLWFQMIKTEDQYFRRLYDKKLCCAGLLCIFNLPSSAVPPAISGALDKVLPEVVRMLRRLKEQEEAAKEERESDESGDEDSSDAATGDMGSHLDPAEEDAAYDEMLAQRRTLIAKLEGGESDNDDLAGLFNDDWTDDEEIETALSNVDVFNMLVSAMNNMKSNEPERFQAIMDNVGEAVRKSMHDLGNYALIRNADQAHNTAHR